MEQPNIYKLTKLLTGAMFAKFVISIYAAIAPCVPFDGSEEAAFLSSAMHRDKWALGGLYLGAIRCAMALSRRERSGHLPTLLVVVFTDGATV